MKKKQKKLNNQKKMIKIMKIMKIYENIYKYIIKKYLLKDFIKRLY